MKVLVTGATGHVGATLTRLLLRQGHEVRALVRGDTLALERLPVERIAGDILDAEAVRRAAEGVEVVFHLAAFISIVPSDGPAMMRINVEGPRNVIAACRASGVRRLVHTSSIHALLDPRDGTITDETRPPNLDPGAPAYDRSKAMGEALVREAVAGGLDAVIVNPTAILGPFQFHPQLHLTMLLDLYHRRMPSLVDGGFNWVDVRDVAAGILAAERQGRAGERYLLGGRWLSVRDVALTVQKVTGSRPPMLTVPTWMALMGVPFAAALASVTGTKPLFTKAAIRALGEHPHIALDKARAELGYDPRPFEATIADTYSFFEHVGLIARGATARPLPPEEDRWSDAA